MKAPTTSIATAMMVTSATCTNNNDIRSGTSRGMIRKRACNPVSSVANNNVNLIATALRNGPYRAPALAPATPWLDDARPMPPALEHGWSGRWRLRAVSGAAPFVWAVWRRVGGTWRFAVQPAAERDIDSAGADLLVASAVSRTGQESERTVARVG